MSEQQPFAQDSPQQDPAGNWWSRKGKRVVLWTGAALSGILLLAVIAGLVIVRTDWFREYVRLRIIEVAQQATGATVELGAFSFDVGSLTARVDGLVLHGSEGDAEDPLARVESVEVGLRIISLLERHVDLASLVITQPQVHIIVNADGTTNVPGRDTPGDGGLFTETLIDLEVGEYEITDGAITYDNRTVPWSARGEDLRLGMTFNALAESYDGTMSTGGVTVTFRDRDPIETILSTNFTLRRTSVDFSELQLATEESFINASGTIADLRTLASDFEIEGAVDVAEMQAMFDLPVRPEGTASLSANIAIAPPEIAGPAVTNPAPGASSTITISALDLTTPAFTASLSGTLQDLSAPRGTLDLEVNSQIANAARLFELPVQPVGRVNLDGQVELDLGLEEFNPTVTGTLTAQGVGYVQNRLQIQGASIRGNLTANTQTLVLRNFVANALGATFTGDSSLPGYRRLTAEGSVSELDVADAVAVATDQMLPWGGVMAGNYRLDTALSGGDLIAEGNLQIVPNGEGEPLQGTVAAVYDQAAQTLSLDSSSLETGSTRVEFAGVLGNELRVRFRSTNLNDVLPAIALAGPDAPMELPLRLGNADGSMPGSATLDGNVTGPLNDPVFAGQATLLNGYVQAGENEFEIPRFNGVITASKQRVDVENLVLARGEAEVTGSASIVARTDGEANGGFANGEIAAELQFTDLELAPLAAEAELGERQIGGRATATIVLAGSVERPQATIDLDIENPAAMGEQMDHLEVGIRYVPGDLRIEDGLLTDGPDRLEFTGQYEHPVGEWDSGEVTFDAVTNALSIERFEASQQLPFPAAATLNGRVHGTGTVTNGSFALMTTNSDLSARNIVLDGVAIGDITAIAETREQELTLNIGGTVLETIIEGSGEWTLEGDAPGMAEVTFTRMGIDSVHTLAMLGRRDAESPSTPPFDGFIEGGLSLSLPLRAPEEITGQVELTAVQVNPQPDQLLRLGVQPTDIILRNEGPISVSFTSTEARVEEASLTGVDTQMTASGLIPFDGSGADISVDGSLNLIVLQLLNPDLLAEGTAAMNATIRGNLQDPEINGQLQLSGASLYLADLPNGVDNAQGMILFNRNRATIRTLTAETGGGTVTFGGFLEFEDGLIYRLQARADSIRVRYPENLSTTFDADLTLTGTSAASTVAGDVILNRAAFNISSDLGQMLTQVSQPTPTPADPNEYLEGMQFDIDIQSAANFQVETTLTRNVEAEADLNLRGTPLRPVLLGSITIERGEVQAFGNRYQVDRGEIRFLNPVRIEPVFDMDLSTRARGVTVNISFSGPVQRLNVNYSSDPPLQSSEIIALLAVGRDPTQASSQTTPGLGQATAPGFVETGSNLLGQAISAQVSSRLQRFFGASRVKIDPTLTGVDNLPQARLTLEQQVSRDITLTYITNLNRTTEQLVRIQWDFSRDWSAIAVRDPSGQFSLDFQFRKRF